MEEKSTENTLIKNMLDKSQEAFLLAIEIYNKPTIKKVTNERKIF